MGLLHTTGWGKCASLKHFRRKTTTCSPRMRAFIHLQSVTQNAVSWDSPTGLKALHIVGMFISSGENCALHVKRKVPQRCCSGDCSGNYTKRIEKTLLKIHVRLKCYEQVAGINTEQAGKKMPKGFDRCYADQKPLFESQIKIFWNPHALRSRYQINNKTLRYTAACTYPCIWSGLPFKGAHGIMSSHSAAEAGDGGGPSHGDSGSGLSALS
jgi:hypothetical protein